MKTAYLKPAEIERLAELQTIIANARLEKRRMANRARQRKFQSAKSLRMQVAREKDGGH